MKPEDFLTAAGEQGWELRAINEASFTISRSGLTYNYSVRMVEETDDETLLTLLDERTDRIAALEIVSKGHQATPEERAGWRYIPSARSMHFCFTNPEGVKHYYEANFKGITPLPHAEIMRLWTRYYEVADEGRLIARRPDDSITPGEFHKLLIEVERLRMTVIESQSVVRATIEHMEAGDFPVPGELRALLDDDDELRWQGELGEVLHGAGHRLSEPLREADLAHYWKRYEAASDEGYLGQEPPWDGVSITPREFRRLLIEINDLHKEIARLRKRMGDEL